MKKLIPAFLCVFLLNSYLQAVSFKPDFYMRLRHEAYTMSEYDTLNSNYFRIKSAIGLNTQFNENLSFYAKLLNENRVYIANVKNASADYSINEAVFENLYFNAANLFNNRIDIRIGRQDLTNYGEGFLVSDGTPRDGTRSLYFNAAKLSLKLNSATIDFIGHSGTMYDQYLPIINQTTPHNILNTSDEQAFMTFVKTNITDTLYIEPYYILKTEDTAQHGYEHINTVGSFIKYDYDSLTAFKVQFAGQSRNQQNTQRTAFGGYAFLDRAKIIFNDKLSFGYTYLSGNDKNTTGNEGWDTLFGRGFWFGSDILAMLFINEQGEYGYWSNLQMYKFEYLVNLTKKFNISAAYNLLYANETVNGTIFGTGKDRGNIAQLRLTYHITNNIRAFCFAEYFKAGDFYNPDQIDNASFFRTELSMKF